MKLRWIALMWLGITCAVSAQAYPDHPIKLVVAYPAGGPADIAARIDAVTLDEVRAAGSAMVGGPRAWAAVGASLALAA